MPETTGVAYMIPDFETGGYIMRVTVEDGAGRAIDVCGYVIPDPEFRRAQRLVKAFLGYP